MLPAIRPGANLANLIREIYGVGSTPAENMFLKYLATHEASLIIFQMELTRYDEGFFLSLKIWHKYSSV